MQPRRDVRLTCLLVPVDRHIIDHDSVGLDETADRLLHQIGSMAEISCRDVRLSRMICKPTFTTAQQFLDLSLAHVVVLQPVEHRNEHHEMSEQFTQTNLVSEPNCVIETFA